MTCILIAWSWFTLGRRHRIACVLAADCQKIVINWVLPPGNQLIWGKTYMFICSMKAIRSTLCLFLSPLPLCYAFVRMWTGFFECSAYGLDVHFKGQVKGPGHFSQKGGSAPGYDCSQVLILTIPFQAV